MNRALQEPSNFFGGSISSRLQQPHGPHCCFVSKMLCHLHISEQELPFLKQSTSTTGQCSADFIEFLKFSSEFSSTLFETGGKIVMSYLRVEKGKMLHPRYNSFRVLPTLVCTFPPRLVFFLTDIGNACTGFCRYTLCMNH